MKIHAAVVRSPHAPMSLETLDLEDIRENEILVRLVATGICHTDIAMRDQAFPVPQPIVLGHEGAGTVTAVGKAVRKVQVGDHVVMTYNSCGHCDSCLEHEASYCHDFFGRNFAGHRPDGTSPLSRDGERVHGNFFGQSSFATYSICSERNVVKVPRTAPLEVLGPLACGIQTGAGAVVNTLRPRMGQSLAVFGSGSVGMAAIMAARAIGLATIIAVDLIRERLDLARELGATHVIDAGSGVDIVAEIRRITGAGVNFGFETTGIMKVLRQALESLAPRGTCGFVGASAVGTELSLDVIDMMTQGKRLRGIVEGDSIPELFIPAMIDLHAQGRFPFDKLVTFYPFERINDAVDDSEAGRVVKPVVRMPA
ncbi:MAG: NAD(P)-dependent alcohol dehydrogenase [Burkholderiales bacterium]|nr:NAD(P)-dependent alcohol dehydrogenase [Burkholderiales bacterium]OJX07318.1 MAG: NAD(P)-dependent alcohol dehydrogenase [Burkholderiales bacterium 70-64]